MSVRTATPHTIDARRMIETARTLNPQIRILVRSRNEEETRLMEAEGHAPCFIAEHVLALAMLQGLRQPAGAAEGGAHAATTAAA